MDDTIFYSIFYILIPWHISHLYLLNFATFLARQYINNFVRHPLFRTKRGIYIYRFYLLPLMIAKSHSYFSLLYIIQLNTFYTTSIDINKRWISLRKLCNLKIFPPFFETCIIQIHSIMLWISVIYFYS